MQVTGGSLWGAPTPVSGPMSLAQIQQQEEREWKQRELHMQQLHVQQQREQQARGSPGWAERPPVASQPVKSLLQIQQEQARQGDKRQQGPALSRSQVSILPTFPPLFRYLHFRRIWIAGVNVWVDQ